MSVWCITLYCHSRHVSHWGFPWAKNITTTGCSSDIPPMLCHSRHASQHGTGFFLQPKNSTISYKCQHKLFHLQSPECSHHGWTLHRLPFTQPAVHWLTRVYTLLCHHIAGRVFTQLSWFGLSKWRCKFPSIYFEYHWWNHHWSGIIQPCFERGWYVLLLWTEVNILPAVNSVWWQNKSSQRLSLCGGRTKSFMFTITV